MSQQKLYDVYVSYPPGIDSERINACLLENLPENEANDLIQALAERSQAIIAENCTKDERENAQQYFSYLGLDVIIRHSLELLPEEIEEDKVQTIFDQCPVCRTMIDNPEETTECPTCRLHFATATEAAIARKRIEWEEKVAFEHKKQQEIAHRMQLEKLAEEKRLRKQIRAELNEKMEKELGAWRWMTWFKGEKVLIAGGIVLAVVFLIAAGYFLGQSGK
ncbi:MULTISPECIES: hypothetical protein [Neisseria]|uniref:Uncharacterized protein n=1 Tax=Neisseria musculi TaxID=1815583 RepID=A0A7H1MBT2_9NEIS|nr:MULTISPECIES: hypothetical protein [Neisseria]MBF0804381.1 hypothetical protein [Neisseria sp. 19428wB4_WF04]QNT59097.1 hypothetical protein H7A79_2472 [Neisseria musculi]TFU42861.1 hypothetical protein E4T99_08520 [Neisseria sp. WF04]